MSGGRRGHGIWKVTAAGCAVTLLLGACSDDANDDSGSASTALSAPTASAEAPTAPTDSPDVAGPFPVTVTHAFGETTVPAEPERVVLVGLTDQDVLLALGVKPVAVREFFGEKPFATWPWAQQLLGDAEPTVLPNQGLNFEEIASLDPDLILGLYAGLTEDEYTTLSGIAPTVAQSADYDAWSAPWQEQLRIAGQTLGRTAEADDVAAATAAALTAAAEDNPQLAGQTVVVAWDFGDGNVGVYAPTDPRSLFMTSIGMTIAPAISDLDYAGGFTYLLSAEQLELLDADAVVLVDNTFDGQARLLDSAVYAALPAVQAGRVVVLPRTADLTGAFGFNTPLSIPAALDGPIPLLTAAVDGDPSTPVPAAT